jgi:GH24 family phage-related lysozyme (muramidase)
VKRGTVWTQDQADAALEADLGKAARAVSSLIGDAPTTQGQFDALTDFVFNVGAGALRSSTLLKKHLAGDYAGAESEFGRWVYASGRKLPGLVKRRAAEAVLYRS